jgi:hypothetical protein
VTHVRAAELFVGALATQVKFQAVATKVGAVFCLEFTLIALVLDPIVVLELDVLLQVQL